MRIVLRMVLPSMMPEEVCAMAELLVRVSRSDEALLRRAFGMDPFQTRWASRPDRVVVDAHVPPRARQICATARAAGVGYLIDPQTYFFQDVQPGTDRWAALPFGIPRALTPEEACRPEFLNDLTHRVIDYQLHYQATALIPPYVYIDRPGSEWIDVQAAMWTTAREYLDSLSVALPVVAVTGLGWRMLHPTQGVEALGPVLRALVDLAPREVALAVSKVDQGAQPEVRAIELVSLIERLANDYAVLLWQQGRLGELAVAAGAHGYETGVGWRETCNLPQVMGARRRTSESNGFTPRPVYVAPLGQSIARRSLDELRGHRDVWTRLICTDLDCCPAGGAAFVERGPDHTIIQRASRLRSLEAIDQPVWRWQNLAEHSQHGLELAARINRLHATGSLTHRVNTNALQSILTVSDRRRRDRRSSVTA
jgi:hypothetical protein